MRIDKNISIEAQDDISAVASDIANIMNAGFFKYVGVPVLLLRPPGMLNVAVNTPVAMSVETSIQLVAVLLTQDSAFVNSSLCSSANNSRGVLPLEFFFSISDGSIIFFTSCHIKI